MKKFLVLLLSMVAISSIVQAASFEDVHGLNCKAAVESLEYIGIVNGMNEKEYMPQKSVTRAELSKMIVSAIKKETESIKSFPDVNGHWGRPYIEQAAGLGILNGYTDGTFLPDKDVTYAEVIAILIRSLGYQNLDSSTSKWYDNYILKMQELSLNEGMEEINNFEKSANRGDIAILLWNTILSSSNGKSLLEKNFSEETYFSNEKITDISIEEGKVVYQTENLKFYVEDDIDFSNLGGLASGFLNKENMTVKGLEIDKGKNYKKIVGNAKSLKEDGYETFTCDNIYGYGNKEHAHYVEIFVNRKTNKVERVVYFDTTESHFAEKLKIGVNKISILSKDVFDTSIILHKGQTITMKILRTESVKDINMNAVIVYDGKIVSWESVPDDSVIRELKKDKIYTYTHRVLEVPLNTKGLSLKKITVDGKDYPYSEECIAENITTDTCTKFSEGITVDDLKTIAEKDKTVKIYLNEYDEVVKLAFTYDVWGNKELEEKKEDKKNLESQLSRIGFVVGVYSRKQNISGDRYTFETMIKSLPKKSPFSVEDSKANFEIGDFVYQTSGEKITKEIDKKTGKEKTVVTKVAKNTNKITSNITVDDLKIVTRYEGYIEDNKIGVFSINSETEFYEVILEKNKTKKDKYSKCSILELDSSALNKNTRYTSLNLILNKDNEVLRVYAMREIGMTANIGIVKKIDTSTISGEKSGDVINQRKVYINNTTRDYNAKDLKLVSSGDLITYESEEKEYTEKVGKKTVKKIERTITIGEIYRHEFIGSDSDLIVNEYSSGKITFKNSKDTISIKDDIFTTNGIEHYWDDYLVVEAIVEKNNKTGEWIFKNYSYSSKEKMKLKTNYRFVVDELTRIIVVYPF